MVLEKLTKIRKLYTVKAGGGGLKQVKRRGFVPVAAPQVEI